MTISVFGIGYVGCVSLGCLAADGYDVIGVDTNSAKIDLINSGIPTVLEKGIDEKINYGVSEKKIIATDDFKYAVRNSEISVICVGTPLDRDGALNLSHVFTVAKQIGAALKSKKEFHIVSVRSSVPPGTISQIGNIIAAESKRISGKDFSVLANPEFLREGNAVNDYYNPPYTLIGGNDKMAMSKLAEIYSSVNGEVIFSDIKNAELIKFVNNSFHALKVSFTNEAANICSKLGIDANEFMELFVKDTKLNISSEYMKPGFAYGGSCLPKDLSALKNIASSNKVTAPIIDSISISNESIINKAFELIINTGKKDIGFIGITFKDGTDDVRNSPYVSLAKKLLDKRYSVKIFDSRINLENLTGANKEYLFKELPVISDYLLHSYRELLSESEVIIVNSYELVKKSELMKIKNKIIVDLIFADESLKSKENYIGLYA
ncbi:MAG: nucleotide sugar dehydrogenase [Bacteroidetes bacterium]|nr:nucleotide sugar dehydrogenase [Bacteroidota bacterium]